MAAGNTGYFTGGGGHNIYDESYDTVDIAKIQIYIYDELQNLMQITMLVGDSAYRKKIYLYMMSCKI